MKGYKMKKDELIKKNVELQNEIKRLEKLLPNTKTDSYIKNHRKKIESFKFTYTRPCLDWFDTINVEIKPDDYYYFKLEKRFGSCWWLIGSIAYDTPDYHWEDKTIGELSPYDLKRFIEWVRKLNEYGCPLVEIKMISGSFDIFEEIKELLEKVE